MWNCSVPSFTESIVRETWYRTKFYCCSGQHLRLPRDGSNLLTACLLSYISFLVSNYRCELRLFHFIHVCVPLITPAITSLQSPHFSPVHVDLRVSLPKNLGPGDEARSGGVRQANYSDVMYVFVNNTWHSDHSIRTHCKPKYIATFLVSYVFREQFER